MKIDKINNPDFQAHLGRHGHNLSHDFSFTSGTGHLLTVFSELMYPKDTIFGKCDMFTRTQPLLQPANVEIDEFIDYFFVPLDMLCSSLGDMIYQVNEPYSQFIKVTNSRDFPVVDFPSVLSSFDVFYPYGENKYGIYSGTDYYGMDILFLSYYRNFFHNGLNPNFLFNKVDADIHDNSYAFPFDRFLPNHLPLTLMAYNAVYQHYYRIDEREAFEPNQYNIDADLYDVNDILGSNRSYQLKYRAKNSDYFVANSVSPFFVNSNIINAGAALTQINNYLSSTGIIPKTATGTASSLSQNNTQVGFPNATGDKFGTASLRSMFAVEKLLSITSRTKKTYDAQVLAHLGVEVPHDVKHEVQYIGTQKSTIKIGEVISTAGTNDTPLGDIAGRGYAVMNDKPIKFTAPVHGIFIGIYSAVPKYRYYVGLEKRNMISSRLDFFTPEYEKLGLQPLFYYELMASDDGNNQNFVCGWQMRYEQYKRRFNKVSPAFVDTIIKGVTGAPHVTESTFNQWHSWTLTRRPLDMGSSAYQNSIKNYLVHPYDLNGLMAVDYLEPTDWNNMVSNDNPLLYFQPLNTSVENRTSFAWNVAQLFYRDPLLHFCKCDFKVVNKMQDNTLPDFVD